MNNLIRKKTDMAVMMPEDESQIIPITSAEQLPKGSDNTRGKYYRLTADIMIGSEYYNNLVFNGVLDGAGHTITFDGARAGIFGRVESDGVIQNLHVEGNMEGSDVLAPFGSSLRGAIVNCYTELSGQYVCGFVKTLDQGTIANCYSIESSEQGAFYKTYRSGVVKNCRWLNHMTLDTTLFPDGCLINSTSSLEDELKTMEFVNSLNENRGPYGAEWGQSLEGFPYFGENQDYVPGQVVWPELPQEGNLCGISFTPYNESEPVNLEDNRLQVVPGLTDGFRRAGTLSLNDYEIPEDCWVAWSCSMAKPKGMISLAEASGELFVYGDGKAVVDANLMDSSGNLVQRLASVAVVAKSKKIEDIRLYINDQDVTNTSYTLAGSTTEVIRVRAKYEGDGEYVDTASYNFLYKAGDPSYIYNEETYASFHFIKPGTSPIVVVSKVQPEVSAFVNLTSTYVPITSIRPAESGSIEIHGRNANSDGQEADGRVAFNPIPGGAIITPDNASYSSEWTITSSDETIGYYSNGAKVYVPKQAGTVTYTATIEDINPETGERKTLTGSSEVTFYYKNPLISVTAPEETIELKAASSVDLNLEFTGEISDQGYNVTEPSMIWTYDKKGIAAVTKPKSGYWKRQVEGAKDNNQYFLSSEFRITGISEGTVVVTGTPVDQKNHPKPVRLTIHVTKGDASDIDNTGLAKEGMQQAVSYIERLHAAEGYSYGDEWAVFALLRNGQGISRDMLDSYYESVVAEIGKWTAGQKPTDMERAALVLTMMGKDITNIEGIDLAEMIYNSPNLAAGSNELIYALLALDAADTDIPDNALWNRASIIKEILKFQNENGAFGLEDDLSVSTDLTAMAVQALAKYEKGNKTAGEAVDKALAYLKNRMGDDFGYGTSEATAQVLLALGVMRIDPLSPDIGFGAVNMNMITNLMNYSCSDGGFVHTPGQTASYEMSTVQVLQAFDAYLRFQNGEEGYWDLAGTSEHLNHTWDKGQVVRETTCAKAGEFSRSCTYCGETEIQEIPALAHTWDAGRVTRKATCAQTGEKTYTCTVCKNTRKESIPVTEHVWGPWKTSASATVFAKETQARLCAVCGQKQTRTVGNPLKPVMKVTAASLPLKVKQSVTKFKVTGLAKGDSVASWKSSNTKIVKVTGKADGSCKITAQKKTGTAKITITLKSGLKKTVKVKVQKSRVKTTKISGVKKTVVLKKGKTMALEPVITPISSRDKITFKSSNSKIVSVTSKGKLKAKKKGTAVITVKAGGKSVKCKVKVK